MAVAARLMMLILIVGAIIWFSLYIYQNFIIPSIYKQDAEEQERRNKAKEAIRSIKVVNKEWIDNQLDDEYFLTHPSMFDMKVPEVARFQRLILDFLAKHPDIHKMPENASVSDEFVQEAQEVVEAFKNAQEASERLDKGK